MFINAQAITPDEHRLSVPISTLLNEAILLIINSLFVKSNMFPSPWTREAIPRRVFRRPDG